MDENVMFEIDRGIMSLNTYEELNHVKATLKIRRQDLGRELISSLSVGEAILIDSNGRIERGTIKKINRTRAVVDIEHKGMYNVPFTMLRRDDV